MLIKDGEPSATMTNGIENTSENTTRGQRAIVVGAGIAGLATALRLERAGWEVLVVERAPGRRSGGYLVNLLGHGYDAAERLGLLPGLAARDLGVFTSILVRADGRQKFVVPAAVAEAALGPRVITVFRGDLEAALYEAVRERVEFRWDATVQTVTEGVDAVEVGLSDGTAARADLLVGADGLHSSVRSVVFGAEDEFLVDQRHVVGAFPLERVPRDVPENAGTTFIGPRRTAGVMNLGTGRSSAFFTYRAEDPAAEVERGPVRALTDAFGDLGGGFRDALAQLETNPAAAYFDSVSQIRMDRWSTRRVVLVGDAAWCVSLFAGYGAALALSGADRLGAALEEHPGDFRTAFAGWEDQLRPEVRHRQASARRGMSQYAPPTRAHIFLQDLMMRAIQLPGMRNLTRRAARSQL